MLRRHVYLLPFVVAACFALKPMLKVAGAELLGLHFGSIRHGPVYPVLTHLMYGYLGAAGMVCSEAKGEGKPVSELRGPAPGRCTGTDRGPPSRRQLGERAAPVVRSIAANHAGAGVSAHTSTGRAPIAPALLSASSMILSTLFKSAARCVMATTVIPRWRARASARAVAAVCCAARVEKALAREISMSMSD